MSDSLLTVAQAIVDGKRTQVAKARAACIANRWAELVDATAPPAPMLLGRLDHAACRKRAAAMFEGPRVVTRRIIPTWVCEAPDEVPESAWYATHAIMETGESPASADAAPGDYGERDASPRLDVAVTCEARSWRVGYVVESRAFAPDVDLVLRRGAFGVLAGEVLELLGVVEDPGQPLERPEIEVPAFCCWFEPRVSGLSPQLVRAIRAMSVTVDEDGAVISRPET